MNPFDIAIPEPDDGFRYLKRPLADGMRASVACDCASCAIIQYLNPSDERVGDFVSEGVAFMGHLLHQAWAYGVFRGERYEVEAAIPWTHGVSHDDVIVHTGPWAGVYEVKTHSESKPRPPSAANRRQSEFRVRLRELAGLPMPGPMRLVMIGKAGRESGMVRGPWEVTLTDERRAEIDAVLEGIDGMLVGNPAVDLHGDELKALSNGCARCFPKPKIDATGDLNSLLGKYATAKREHDAYDTQRKKYADAKKALADDMEKTRALIDKRVARGVVVESMSGATATRNRAGTLTITVPAEAAQNAA
jgi:hypothetical protein